MSSGELVGLDDWSALTQKRLNASQTEDHLIWLIQLGVLRREVDGQGLTSRFRLTPLGRQLLDDTPDLLDLPVSWTEALQHWLRRRIS